MSQYLLGVKISWRSPKGTYFFCLVLFIILHPPDF